MSALFWNTVTEDMRLKDLFEVAPQKYPSVRDFEVQVVKRLVYFDTADYDPDPNLLTSLSWNSVKDYFTQQAKKIEQGWLK
jgi:hypothetical protein